MSFLYRDASLVPRARLNQAMAAYNIFKDFWGTETINGIEVYKPKRLVYHNGFISDTVVKKFIKSIGTDWEEWIAQDVDKEIETIYFEFKDGYQWNGDLPYTFNKGIATATLRAPTAQEISDAINASFKVNDEFKATVSYGGGTQRYVNEHVLEWHADGGQIVTGPLNTNDIRSIIEANPWYHLVNTRYINYSKDSMPFQNYDGDGVIGTTGFRQTDRKLNVGAAEGSESRFSIFALLGDESVFDPEVDVDGNKVLYDEKITTANGSGGEVLRYRYSYNYTFKGCAPTSNIVKEMLEWYKNYHQDVSILGFNPVANDRFKEAQTTSMIDNNFKKIMYKLMVDTGTEGRTDPYIEDQIYLKVLDEQSMGYTSYIKVDGLAGIKKRDFVKFLSSQLDTDYTVEKKEWWEVVLFLLTIIVSVAIGIFTAGAGAPITFGWIATFAGVTSISLSVGGALLSAVGGLSTNGLVKVIGAVAQVLGYVAAVTGVLSVYNSIRESIAQASRTTAEQLTGDLLDQAVSEVTIGDVLDYAIDKAVESVTSVFTSNPTVMEVVNYIGDAIKIVKTINDYMVDKEMEDLNKEQAALTKEQKEWEDSLSSNVFKDGSLILQTELDRVASYDAITNTSVTMDSLLLGDKNFNSWYTGVNS